MPRDTVTLGGRFEGSMDSGAETQAGPVGVGQVPPFPKIWIGYLLGIATFIAEVVAVSLHPEIAKGAAIIPPLYLFLPVFVGAVYWLVCIHQYHVVMKHIPGWHHSISPAKAVGYHFIPLYNLYWIFKWLQEIAKFVNASLQRPVMRPNALGIAILVALVLRFIDAGLGMLLLFLATSYVSTCLRPALAAFAASAQAPQGPPPFS
jgi:hypothetical protein